MRLRGNHGAHGSFASEGARRTRRGVISALTATLLGAAGLVAISTANSSATQATGDDVTAFQTGWSWTYATTFNYNDNAGTNVNLNETVTYTDTGVTTFGGQSAYNIALTGTITGCSGTAEAGTTSASLSNCTGTVTGSQIQRRSDLAILQESQHQNLSAKASVSIISVNVTATIDLTLTPTPSWHSLDFPLNAGDTWNENENIAYTGGFSYDAGSIGSGSSPFDGSFPLAAPATVSHVNDTVGAGTFATDFVAAASSDGTSVDNQWYAPSVKNDAQEHLRLPLGGAVLTLDRSLSSSSTPAPGNPLSETITPSLSCAGGNVTVNGNLGSGAAGVGVTATLDQSQINPGQTTVRTTTTATGGTYSVTLPVPGDSDQLGKNGSRANWGITVDAGTSSAAATLVVTPQDCTTLSYTGPTSGPQGSSATVSAQLTDLAGSAGAAGQTITFALSGGTSVNATTGTNGIATATLPIAGPPRGATVTATLAATSGLTGATASSPFAVQTDPTTTTVVSSESSATIGDALTFTATVTPGVGSHPTGTVQFKVDGSNFGAAAAVASNGTATSSALSTLALGDHSVQAIYSGDANFAGSTSAAINVHVHNPLTATNVTVSADAPTPVVGQTVTLTSTVSPKTGGGDPTGSVTFTDNGNPIGSGTVTNVGGTVEATFTTSSLGLGSHSITATYSGDDSFNGNVSSPTTVTVGQADTTTTLVSSATGTTVTGEGINYSASVAAAAPGSGTPTGTVQLLVDGNPAGGAVGLVGGSAAFPTLTSLTAGSHTVSVSYSGDTNYATSGDSQTQNVNLADTTTSITATPSPALEEQAVTITATVSPSAPGSGAPTGTVTFSADGNSIGAAPLTPHTTGSTASITVTTLAAGGHTITASYIGDDNYNPSDSAPIGETILSATAAAATTTTLSSSVNPSTFGQLVTFTATLSSVDPINGTPTGSVQFSVDGTNIGDPVTVGIDGTAVSPTLASPPPGDHTVIAAFAPDGAFAASGDTLTQVVADASVTLGVTSSNSHSSYGDALAFSASVASNQIGTGVPTGTVQFRVDGAAVGDPVTLDDSGNATSSSIATLAPGAHTVTAIYSGDEDFLNAVATTPQSVGQISTTTAFASSVNPATYGQLVTFTATVTPGSTAQGAPFGTVTFTDGGATLSTVTLVASGTSAKTTYSTSILSGGSHSIKATFNGDPLFAGSSSGTVTETIAKVATVMVAASAVVKLTPSTISAGAGINGISLPLGALQAQLKTAAGAPVVGRTVVFTIGSATACTTTTDASGIANCDANKMLVQLLLAGKYVVTFSGDGNYLASSANGKLIQ